jgi:putative ribosome biogenesis GTPase RsgA
MQHPSLQCIHSIKPTPRTVIQALRHSTTCHLPAPQADPTVVIFCGNPGVGKSTLLSSISGCKFESGMTWGEGKTSKLQILASTVDFWKKACYEFGDTPGLANIKMIKQAAKAICDALS